MSVKLISITPEAERIIAYCARVSNPANQENEAIAGLLRYCIRHGHWSVFEQAAMTLEITCEVAIATQIIRHHSFRFQQFSQRYAEAFGIRPIELRRQDNVNRQNSIDDLDPLLVESFQREISNLNTQTLELYERMLESGVAKECARFVLPQATETRMYMTGNIRDWIHYINLRSGNGTQLEHQRVAKEAKRIFIEQLPTIAKALNWYNADIPSITA